MEDEFSEEERQELQAFLRKSKEARTMAEGLSSLEDDLVSKRLIDAGLNLPSTVNDRKLRLLLNLLRLRNPGGQGAKVRVLKVSHLPEYAYDLVDEEEITLPRVKRKGRSAKSDEGNKSDIRETQPADTVASSDESDLPTRGYQNLRTPATPAVTSQNSSAVEVVQGNVGTPNPTRVTLSPEVVQYLQHMGQWAQATPWIPAAPPQGPLMPSAPQVNVERREAQTTHIDMDGLKQSRTTKQDSVQTITKSQVTSPNSGRQYQRVLKSMSVLNMSADVIEENVVPAGKSARRRTENSVDTLRQGKRPSREGRCQQRKGKGTTSHHLRKSRRETEEECTSDTSADSDITASDATESETVEESSEGSDSEREVSPRRGSRASDSDSSESSDSSDTELEESRKIHRSKRLRNQDRGLKKRDKSRRSGELRKRSTPIESPKQGQLFRSSTKNNLYRAEINIKFIEFLHHRQVQFEDDGRERPEAFLEQMEESRDLFGLSDSEVLSAIPAVLIKSALEWYQAVRKRIKDWSDFKKLFKHQFKRGLRESDIKAELKGRSQAPEETISDYLVAFWTIVGWFKNPPSEKRLLKIAKDNLLPEYRRYVFEKTVDSFAALERYGRRWERMQAMDHQYHQPLPKMRIQAAKPKPSRKVAKVAATSTTERVDSDRSDREKMGKSASKKQQSRKVDFQLAQSVSAAGSASGPSAELVLESPNNSGPIEVLPAEQVLPYGSASIPPLLTPQWNDARIQHPSAGQSSGQQQRPVQGNRGVRLCFTCQAPGHLSNRCPTRTCFACKQNGHIASICPNRSQSLGQNSVTRCQVCGGWGAEFWSCSNADCAHLKSVRGNGSAGKHE